MIAICLDNIENICRENEIYEVKSHEWYHHLYYVFGDKNRCFCFQKNKFRILTNQEIRILKLKKICQV